MSSCVSLDHSYLEPQSGNTASKQTKQTEADKTAAGGKATHAVWYKQSGSIISVIPWASLSRSVFVCDDC